MTEVYQTFSTLEGPTIVSKQPTARLRFINSVSQCAGTVKILQQCWVITEYKNGKAVSQKEKWIDVPVVNEGE